MSNKNATTLAGAVAGVNNSSKEYRIGISDSAWTSRMAASSIENGIYVGSWNESYGCYQLTLGTGYNKDDIGGGWGIYSYRLTIPLRLFNILNGKEETNVSWSVEPISTHFTPSIDTNGNLLVIGPYIEGYNIHDYSISGSYDIRDYPQYAKSEIVKIKAVVKNTEVTVVGWFGTLFEMICLSDDTLLTLFDDSQKELKDITKNDVLKVWNFDEGRYDTSEILWLLPTRIAKEYQRIVTNTGREIKQIYKHRIFSLEQNKFVPCPELKIGDKIWTVDGVEEVISADWIYEPIKYRNVITKYHMNVVTNGFLTSCGLNNIYPIENMKFVKEDRQLRNIEDYDNIPQEYFNGLRLSEQYADTEEISKYVRRMIENGI